MHFLSSKSTLETNKCEEHAVVGKWPPLLVTSPHGVTLWTEKQWQSISFVKISFSIKVEMMLRFCKLENFLSLFVSAYLYVILLQNWLSS